MAQPHRYKLTYFDFSGSRGEECRLALHVAGVEFDDHRLGRDEWTALKPTTPFGALPVLTIEGKGELAQSNAILGFIGRAHDLHPADVFEAARHDAILAAVEELRAKIDPSMRTKDEAEKQRMREELATGYMQAWGANIERQIAGPFLAGERIHVADIKLYVVLNWFAKGALDHIPRDVFAAFPKVVRLFDAVKTHPRVVDWTSRFPT
jgi:glutathione S-transferase